MRADAPSLTAAWVALARYLGRLLPAESQLAEDPYGALFSAPAAAEALARSAAGRRLAVRPGLGTWIAYLQVRTRVIDDDVRAFVARGGRQLVVLGAGYDCRALRLPELAGAAVFEIDHPATQRHKREVLAARAIASPARYLEWDFEARPVGELPEALAAAGLDRTAPVLTIWEGVTMYLTEPAIDASLRAIAAWSAPGSELVMTYFARDRLARPSLYGRAVRAVVARVGEPFRWSWRREELPGYLRERGFDLVDDVVTQDAARALLPPELARLVRRADTGFARAIRR